MNPTGFKFERMAMSNLSLGKKMITRKYIMSVGYHDNGIILKNAVITQ